MDLPLLILNVLALKQFRALTPQHNIRLIAAAVSNSPPKKENQTIDTENITCEQPFKRLGAMQGNLGKALKGLMRFSAVAN